MPIIQVHCSQLNTKQKKEMIQQLTKVTAKITNLPQKEVSIIIQQYPPDQIGLGGKQLSEIVASKK